MRVLNYQARNVLRIKDVDFNLEGHNLFLVGGKNAQGKSSAIKALLMALCGRSGMEDYPEVALRAGQDQGWVKVELSGSDDLHESEKLTVELFLRRKRNGQVIEEFRILDSAGEEAPEPRTLLKRMFEMRGFDPLEFERMDKKSRREKLLKLLGLDFTADRKQHKKLYDERADVNRDGVRLKGRVEAMSHYPEAPKESVSVESLMEELEKRAAVNRENERARKDLKTRADLVQIGESNVRKALDEVEKARQALAKAEQAASDAEEALRVERERHDEQKEIVAKLVDENVEEVRTKMRQAEQVNSQVAANKERIAKLAELESLRADSQRLTDQMKEIEERQAEAIKNAKFPVPGMAFDDEGVLLNDLPFEQASKRERIVASFQVGMALNPELRLLVCQDGGDLDDEAIAALDTMLKEHDFQAIVELVTRSESDRELCQVIIRDGMVDSPDSAPAEAQAV